MDPVEPEYSAIAKTFTVEIQSQRVNHTLRIVLYLAGIIALALVIILAVLVWG